MSHLTCARLPYNLYCVGRDVTLHNPIKSLNLCRSLVLISNIFSCDLIFQVPSVLVRSHWAWRLVGAFYLMLCWEGETLASEQFSARRVLTFFLYVFDVVCLMME